MLWWLCRRDVLGMGVPLLEGICHCWGGGRGRCFRRAGDGIVDCGGENTENDPSGKIGTTPGPGVTRICGVIGGTTLLSASGRCTHRPELPPRIGRGVPRPMSDKSVRPTRRRARTH